MIGYMACQECGRFPFTENGKNMKYPQSKKIFAVCMSLNDAKSSVTRRKPFDIYKVDFVPEDATTDNKTGIALNYTSNVKIISKVSIDENDDLNVGRDNRGYSNRGSNNIGSENVGSYNLGIHNAGDGNLGQHNVGCSNYGSNNIGMSNQGWRNEGSGNRGDGNVGDVNYGCFNYGYHNYGYNNMGHGNYGTFNIGNDNYGKCNVTDRGIGYFNTKPSPAFCLFDEIVPIDKIEQIRDAMDDYVIGSFNRIDHITVRTRPCKGSFTYEVDDEPNTIHYVCNVYNTDNNCVLKYVVDAEAREELKELIKDLSLGIDFDEKIDEFFDKYVEKE